MTTASGRRAPWWVALLAIVLLQVAWAVALPGWRGPDEIEHVKRASAVAGGEIVAAAGANDTGHTYVSVERDVSSALRSSCVDLHQDLQPESCEAAADDGPDRVLMPATTAGYNPAYYLLVAPASWLLEGNGTLWGIRSIGAGVAALLLAWAWRRRAATATTRWQGVGLMLCLTPAVTFASVVGAPNGIHLAAALLLWVGITTRRADTPPAGADRCRGAAIGVAAAAMVLTHALGVFWLACAFVVLWLWQGRAGIRALVRDLRAAPSTALAAVAATAVVAGWALLVRTNDTSVGDPLAASTKEIPAFAHAIVWVFQVVGTMPYRFGLVWPVVYALWIAAVVALVWSALRARDRRATLAVVGALAAACVVPVAVTVLTYDDLGFAWQGRYELPLLFAVPLISAEVTRGVLPRIRHSADAVVGVAGTGLCLAVACLALREQVAPALAALAVLLAAAGWCGSWWALRSRVASMGPPTPGAGRVEPDGVPAVDPTAAR